MSMEIIFTGMTNAGMSIGGGGEGGYRRRGVLEFKAIQFLKPLGGDKGSVRQCYRTFVTAMYTLHDEYGDLFKAIAN